MRKITIIFTYLLSLLVAKAQTSQNTSYEEQGYVPWFEVNYAQIAYENKANISRCIFKHSSLYFPPIYGVDTTPFYCIYEGTDGTEETVLPENIMTAHTETNIELGSTKTNMGLIFPKERILGMVFLKQSDKIEIAVKKETNNVSPLGITKKNVWGTTNSGSYNFEFTLDSEDSQIQYDVYTTTVTENGSVSWEFDQKVCIAYIKIYRLESSLTPFYLIGDMTKNEVNDWVPNPSYEFKTSDGGLSYNLTVGSILKGQLFQIVNSDMTEWYGRYHSDNTPFLVNYNDSFIVDLNHDKTVTNKYDMTFSIDVINTLFTFYPVYTPKLSILGTAVNSEALIISPGNDQTMQSGVVDNDHIDLITVSDRAMVYIHLPESFNEDLYYMVVPNNGVQEIKSREGSNRVKANINDGYFTVGLALGSGSILVYTDPDSENPKQTFTYTVTKGIPTGIQLETAEETEAVYFNLQGVKITNPERGNLYIKVLNGKASKVIL